MEERSGSSQRDEIHRLVDALPEDRIEAAGRLLKLLLGGRS